MHRDHALDVPSSLRLSEVLTVDLPPHGFERYAKTRAV
jgi:hypothetical protein